MKVMVSPSASVALPGVQLSESLVVAVAGVKVRLLSVGAEFPMMMDAVPGSPEAMPSVGVTSMDQVSPRCVSALASVVVVLAEESVPFLNQA